MIITYLIILAVVVVVGGLINLISCGKSYKIHKRSSLRSRSSSVASNKSGSLEAAINKLNRTKKTPPGLTKSDSKLNRSVSITDSLLLEPIKKNSNMIAELETSQKMWPKTAAQKKPEPSAPAEETAKSFSEIRAILMRNERFKSAVEASKHLPVLKNDNDNVSIKSNKSRSFVDIRPVKFFNEAEFKSQSRKVLFLKK